MASPFPPLLLVLALLAAGLSMVPPGQSLPDQSEKAVDKWFEKLSTAKPKSKKLHFFIHDISAGKDPSIVPVAKANSTAGSPTQFGVINVVDDLLTAGPAESSKRVGYVQGVYVSASKETVSLLVALNFVITEGRHNGSTLSVVGQIAEFSDNREFPILGGSGDFRLAQGIAVAKVHSADAATGNRISWCLRRVLAVPSPPSSRRLLRRLLAVAGPGVVALSPIHPPSRRPARFSGVLAVPSPPSRPIRSPGRFAVHLRRALRRPARFLQLDSSSSIPPSCPPPCPPPSISRPLARFLHLSSSVVPSFRRALRRAISAVQAESPPSSS